MKKFYITTAIPYVNASPHIGHALEFVQADVIARFHRLLGEDVFFLTGTDENAQKNVLAAEENGINVKEFVDRNVKEFKKTLKLLQISNDDFIRTSDKKRHWPAASKIWEACEKNGDIYKKKYVGLYCIGCEAFLTEKDLENGLCPEHLKPPERVSEENYFFRLSKYQKKLEELISKGVIKIIPETRKREVLEFIKSGLEDFSISRPSERMRGWGIPVPGDETQIIYVWFDALVNYLSGIGYGSENLELFEKYWPADLHVIGKGITRFHAIYWPAILLSAKLPLPKCIFVHGYVTVEGKKMSKSLGNVINPNELVKKYGCDATRYFLLREIPTFEDGDFSEKSLREKVNNELVANLGNFIYRVLSFIYRYFNGIIEAPGEMENSDGEIVEKIKEAPAKVANLIQSIKLREGLEEILNLSSEGNRYFQENKPWELIKVDRKRCSTVLYVCANLCRCIAILLYPYLPRASEEILKQLNVSEELNWFNAGELKIKPGHKINKPKILFRKIEVEEEGKSGEEMISFEEFEKVELKVGEVLEVEEVPKSRNLYKLKVDVGEIKQAIAGLKPYYKPEELKGKKFIFVTNLKPREIMGLKSEVMILAAQDKEGKVVLIRPEKDISNGSRIK